MSCATLYKKEAHAVTKILCSTSLPFAHEAFTTLGDVVLKEPRAITADDVRDVDILAVRSTTRVDEALLADSAVRFVGTATIGTDHMDLGYFERRGIAWCYAPGCNANSVAEYVTAALLCLADRNGLALADKTIGVIGVGNVGSRVVPKAQALGMNVLLNDPPRERAEGAGAPVFRSLPEVLAQSDIVTLHVPLTREGPDATWHMADEAFFAALKPGAILLNSARGAVLRTDALLGALSDGTVAHAVIDTWEGEPAHRPGLLERVALGTPHIAGYSFEGRVNGTVQVYREACRFLGVEPTWTPDALMPEAPVPVVALDATIQGPLEAALHAAVSRIYDIEADDRRLRDSCVDDEAARGTAFDRLRKQYPVRREFASAEVRGECPELLECLRDLGFR